MLKEIFCLLMKKQTDSEAYILECWKEIENHYSSELRFYHNLDHIKDMLLELENIEPEDKDALLFSIFYHDIIYDTAKSDNELQSAILFKKRMERTHFKPIEKCVQQIELTQEHKLSTHKDTNILFDLDLAILGKSSEKYQEYAQNIRKEYKMYSDSEYRIGRSKVLHEFLDSPSIYKTNYFTAKLEAKARMNISHELNSLNE
jgi:predicted metal-dependent HD superfamily phosphohydrolase